MSSTTRRAVAHQPRIVTSSPNRAAGAKGHQFLLENDPSNCPHLLERLWRVWSWRAEGAELGAATTAAAPTRRERRASLMVIDRCALKVEAGEREYEGENESKKETDGRGETGDG